MMLSSAAPEHGQRISRLDFAEFAGHGLTDGDFALGSVDQVGNDSHALIELDQDYRQRIVESLHFRLMDHNEAVNFATSLGSDRGPIQRMTVRAHRPRWMPQPPAAIAGLDQQFSAVQPVPKESIIMSDRRSRMR